MRYLSIFFVFIALGLAACKQPEVELPPTLALADTPVPLNTRVLETPTPPIPPTWTPDPATVEREVELEHGMGDGSSTSSGDATTYIIQSGDTLTIIAGRFDVSVQALADANNIANWNIIEVGETLVIPK